jgi:hypothetical protein
MTAHTFPFEPGEWLGEGTITFTASPEKLSFYTSWTIQDGDNALLLCTQNVEVDGSPEKMCNNFLIKKKSEADFDISLSNALIQDVKGCGVIDENCVAWEFELQKDFEGFEVYEKSHSNEYNMHAEYLSSDQFKTIIDGRIWKKGTKS